MIKIQCANPECDASYSISDEHAGRVGRCKKCGCKFPLSPATRLPATSPPNPDAGDPFPEEPTPDLPTAFGRYRVIKKLGQGGMGAVYLAHDTELDRDVALKVPHPEFGASPQVLERFFREARAAARFHHPNFCPIYDVGNLGSIRYLALAYIEGQPLSELVGRDRPLPQRRAAEIIRTLALALAEAHRRGIIHRDLKPANVMVKPGGDLVLMDFGLARRSDTDDPRLTVTGMVLGTPAYMAPEQVKGDPNTIGPAADIYSLGVVLYELLTGRRPFEGAPTYVLGQILTIEPPPPSSRRADLDPALEAICLKAMAKEIVDRYPTMAAFAEALDYLPGPHRSRLSPSRNRPRHTGPTISSPIRSA